MEFCIVKKVSDMNATVKKYSGVLIFLSLFNTSSAQSAATIQHKSAVSNSPVSYLIGGIIALLIMGYLIYTLLHPDKF
jgi:K+-transporting ATPase KdpF subunit